MLLMLRRDEGGYSRELGWTGSRTDKLDDALPPGEPHERFADDRFSEGGAWVTLTDHLRDTGREAAHVVQALSLADDLGSALGSAVIRASSEHDIGKALPQWQGALPKPPPREGGVWAKAPYQFAIVADVSTAASEAEAVLRTSGVRHGRAESQEPDVASGEARFTWHTESKVSRTVLERIRALPGVVRAWNVPFRPGLRHEAATALALWHSYYHSKNRGFTALSIYLCAAHHGKVRTVLTSRSDGGEDVCGIPKTTAALPWKEMPLDFACGGRRSVGPASRKVGRSSSSKRPAGPGSLPTCSALGSPIRRRASAAPCRTASRAISGPFALAYLETLVRCADERASKAPSTPSTPTE